jgi:D-glycero-D-manno-heptose 1,7-bisphosphate phosphatase
VLSAVFLDRDGVINENREDYVKSVDELKFLPGSVEAISRLTAAGFRVIIVSNQQGVGRGLILHETLEQINKALLDELASVGSGVSGIYYCPHLKEEDCACRKPKPGLLLQAAADMGFDVAGSVFVGDSVGDIEAGRAAGCQTILVLSGKTMEHEVAAMRTRPDHVVPDLSEAAELIVREFTPDV